MSDGATYICTLPTGTKIIRRADRLDMAVDPKRLFLVEKPDGTVCWIRADGSEQPHIRDN